MKTKKRLFLFLCGIACMALVLAGCQKVGGVDLNRYLLGSLETESLEGKGSVILDITDAKSGESRHIELNYSSFKMQDKERMSLAGDLVFDHIKLPIKLQMDGQTYLLELGGLSKPIRLQLSELTGTEELGFDPTELELFQQLQDKLMPFVVKHLPNPKTIDVEQVTENVNGETLQLTKVHAEIKASEFLELFFAFFDSALADEEGMKEAIRTVLEMVAESDPSSVEPDMSGVYYEFLKAMSDDLKKEIEDSLTAEDKDVLNNPQNYLKTDLYLDNALNLRKAEAELSVTDKDFSLKIASSAEQWNIGGNVTVDPIDTSNGVIEISGPSWNVEFLRAVDRNSVLFRLLKDELKLAKKDVRLSLKDDDVYRAFIDEKTEKGMVPVRFVSERLDGDVKWIAETQKVVVTDAWTGRTIEMTIGSDMALVDGRSVNMGAPAMLVGDTTYVPVRSIAEQFGAQVDWNAETETVLITRE